MRMLKLKPTSGCVNNFTCVLPRVPPTAGRIPAGSSQGMYLGLVSVNSRVALIRGYESHYCVQLRELHAALESIQYVVGARRYGHVALHFYIQYFRAQT